MNVIQNRRRQGLLFAGRPADLDAIDSRGLAQSEVQAPLILGAKAAAARNFLQLLLAVPEDSHLGADGAAITLAALQIKLDPVIVRRNRIAVEQQGSALVGY